MLTRKENRRQYMKERRATAKQSGLCMLCFKVPPTANRVKCNYCRTYTKDSMIRTKLAAFNAYGGAVCACCGIDNIKFLTLDHVNDDGAQQRKQLKQGTGNAFYRWLKKNNYPPGYRVLCFNCNSGRACNGGVCPHEEERQRLFAVLPAVVHY